MRNLYFHNLTNLYTKTNANKINSDFRRILEQSRDGVCGIEVKVNRGGISYTLVSPSFLRQNIEVKGHDKYYLDEENTFFEGYLYQPFFLPLNTNMDGEFIQRLQSLSFILKEDETLFIQLLFKRAYNWQEKAIQMYSSYIEGNDYPLTFSIGRKVQERFIGLSSRLGTFVGMRDYIEDAEQKIISEGYCFKLSVVVDSTREKYLIDRLQGLFDQYAYFNNIKLAKVKGKGSLQHINNCVMTPDTKYQILSLGEIMSLVGGNNVVIEGSVVEETSNRNELTVNNAIELLPDYPIQLQQMEIGDGLVQEIGEALKRVGITKQARIYNASVVTGVRLTVVQFDIPKSVKLTDITKKQKDIQAALGFDSLSLEQGNEKDTIKMSIPNEQPAIVGLRGLLELGSFKEYSKKHELSFVAGVDEINNPIFLNMVELVHLMISGSTGSGKSVMIFSIALQLMLMNSPEKLKLIMIDPKQVEFQYFSQFPHTGVITDMNRASSVLDKLTEEMESRYVTFLEAGVRRIDLYNQKILDPDSNFKAPLMPYIVAIIDEYADLKMTHPDVEEYIARLGQKARSAGIHIILATQRPSSDIINGNIKSNILNAISFNLGNSNNYKTVFGTGIPYNLLGRGDGCFKVNFWHKDFQRFQSPIICKDESQEEELYNRLADYLNRKYKNKLKRHEIIDVELEEEVEEDNNEDDNLNRLKEIITITGEVRTTELRKQMKVKNTTITNLMKDLVEEGFLLPPESRQSGYKINPEYNEKTKKYP